ncbi:Anti-sigma-K factor RskA [Catalinimonas alkaloidigena]|uniref:Regulator of SigK n=1 Tax=Catalinimonas alkaloidigena TaxID=1075417 RepID=A0A1G9P944_9BACT|nr:anti-sigma factor [Catalinimonas alkaloidigena]SDL95279.1 Anti-sigma-K factor RskA [Catalinimonas alkaloidigena]
MEQLDEIKNSGLLEEYVLGTATPEEQARVQALMERYPEIREEVEALAQALEQYGQLHAVTPPAPLRARILDAIDQLDTPASAAAPAPVLTASRPARGLYWALGAAASVALIATVTSVVFYQQKEAAESELLALQTQIEAAQQENSRLIAFTDQLRQQNDVLRDTNTTAVPMTGLPLAPEALAVVYVNGKDQQAYLNVLNLPEPPAGSQYQLWGIVDGTPVSMGVFDVATPEGLLQKVPFVGLAQAYAVTLEKAGGSPTPTLEQMYVMGQVG